MRRFLLFELILLFCCGLALGQISPNNPPNPLPGNLYTTPPANSSSSGGGVGSPAVGPVINVTNPTYAGGAAPSNLDNNAAFTAAISAANAAAYVSQSAFVFHTPVVINPVASTNVISATVTASKGDTIFIGTQGGAAATTFTITDAGGDVFAPIATAGSGQYCPSTCMSAFVSGVGTVPAQSGTLTITASGATNTYSAIIQVVSNVGSLGLFKPVNGSSTAPSNVSFPATQDANNAVLSFVLWYFNGASTISSNVGTLQASIAGTSVSSGAAVITNTAASAGTTVTTSGTISQSSAWEVFPIELRSVAITIPTVYFPAGYYNYSGGINPQKSMTLEFEPGSQMCYTGKGKAMDLGASNLTINNYELKPMTIMGGYFTCGEQMTAGIFFEPYYVFTRIYRSTFFDFGNPVFGNPTAAGNTASWAVVYSTGNYSEIVDHPLWQTDDNVTRNFILNNTDGQGQLDVEGGAVGCGQAAQFGGGGGNCLALGIGIFTNGFSSRITGVNFNFMQTSIWLNAALGFRIDHNYFEATNQGSGFTNPVIVYQGANDGAIVESNYNNAHSFNYFIGPSTGTDTMSNWIFSHNYIVSLPAINEVIKMNNLTGQGGNLSFMNVCGTAALGTTSPCPKLHTTGGNITQWNGDYAGQCTLTTGACPAYSFISTYSVAPKCTASWNGTGTFTGILKVATSTTQLTITDTVSESTGVISWSCNPDAQ